MSKFAILLGGALTKTPRLDAALAGARVIAADSGIRHVPLLGVEPELWIGDFDSVTAEDLDRHPALVREVYPPEKDSTDGELAASAALARGATSLIFAGAFGGPRADHAFQHMAAAIGFAERGIAVLLTSGCEEGRPLSRSEARYDYGEGTQFSILAFSDLAGLTVRGAKWPLADVEIPFGSSITISNEVSGELAVSLRRGRALILARPEDCTEL